MKRINIAITGGLGKMGQKIINSSKKDKKFKITSITESKVLNKKVSGLELQINSKNAFKDAQVIIDFSVPKCTLAILKIASLLKKRVVIGTTGFSNKEELITFLCQICEDILSKDLKRVLTSKEYFYDVLKTGEQKSTKKYKEIISNQESFNRRFKDLL